MKLHILSSLWSGPLVDKGTLSKKKEGPLWVWPPALRRPQATETTNKVHYACHTDCQGQVGRWPGF